MEAISPQEWQDVASFDPRGLIGRIYVETTRRALDITSY